MIAPKKEIFFGKNVQSRDVSMSPNAKIVSRSISILVLGHFLKVTSVHFCCKNFEDYPVHFNCRDENSLQSLPESGNIGFFECCGGDYFLYYVPVKNETAEDMPKRKAAFSKETLRFF